MSNIDYYVNRVIEEIKSESVYRPVSYTHLTLPTT